MSIAGLCAFAALSTGCGASASTLLSSPSPTLTPTAQTTLVSVYFLRDGKIAAAHRTVPVSASVESAAISALLNGPTTIELATGMVSNLPSGARLLGLTLDTSQPAGLATVNFSREFESAAGASMAGRLAQVVFTLTHFNGIQKVRFEVEGVIGEGPVSRADYEQQAPAILVESPAVGDRVKSPLRVAGTANTFEATFQLQIETRDGSIFADQVVHATSGTGTRGTFDVSVLFDGSHAGPSLLEVFERSAKDGSPINVVTIPLELVG